MRASRRHTSEGVWGGGMGNVGQALGGRGAAVMVVQGLLWATRLLK